MMPFQYHTFIQSKLLRVTLIDHHHCFAHVSRGWSQYTKTSISILSTIGLLSYIRCHGYLRTLSQGPIVIVALDMIIAGHLCQAELITTFLYLKEDDDSLSMVNRISRGSLSYLADRILEISRDIDLLDTIVPLVMVMIGKAFVEFNDISVKRLLE